MAMINFLSPSESVERVLEENEYRVEVSSAEFNLNEQAWEVVLFPLSLTGQTDDDVEGVISTLRQQFSDDNVKINNSLMGLVTISVIFPED
jgi:hypothetical protein